MASCDVSSSVVAVKDLRGKIIKLLAQHPILPPETFNFFYVEEPEKALEKAISISLPLCKTNYDVYTWCGELVHAVAESDEILFQYYVDQMPLQHEVRQFMKNNNEMILLTIHEPDVVELHDVFTKRGLQSAQRLYKFYLKKLPAGQETFSEMCTRLSATVAATSIMKPAYARTLRGDAQDVFKRLYKHLLSGKIVPATPAILNMGLIGKCCTSCFLINDPDSSSTRGMLSMIGNQVLPVISNNGGVGINFNHYNNNSVARPDGIIPMLKILDIATKANNSEETRQTGVAVYVEPWHSDIERIISLRNNVGGDPNDKCDGLFPALWMNDLLLFRYKWQPNSMWTLFGEEEGKVLSQLYGEEFKQKYEQFEAEGRGVKQIPVKELLFKIIQNLVMTGTPFIVFKDQCRKCYYNSSLPLTCSNLCTEIIHHADKDTVGTCNLCSLDMTKFVKTKPDGEIIFHFKEFKEAVELAVIFINAMIDTSTFATKEIETSAREIRSLGIGVQGLHDAFTMMKMPYDSIIAYYFSAEIARELYLTAVDTSCKLCENGLPPFRGFEDSKYKSGWLHFDEWKHERERESKDEFVQQLRQRVKTYGLCNSQFVAMMPTVSSSLVAGVSESVYPRTSNVVTYVTKQGEVTVPNKFLHQHINECSGGNNDIKSAIIEKLEDSNWENLKRIKDQDFSLFETAFDCNMKSVIEHALARAPYVDHSQSMSLYVREKKNQVSAWSILGGLIYAMEGGAKTGIYYCKVNKETSTKVFLTQRKAEDKEEQQQNCDSCQL